MGWLKKHIVRKILNVDSVIQRRGGIALASLTLFYHFTQALHQRSPFLTADHLRSSSQRTYTNPY